MPCVSSRIMNYNTKANLVLKRYPIMNELFDKRPKMVDKSLLQSNENEENTDSE